MADTHKYMGTHAQEVKVGDTTVMLAPLQTVTLSTDDAMMPDTRDMIESGILMSLPAAKGGEE